MKIQVNLVKLFGLFLFVTGPAVSFFLYIYADVSELAQDTRCESTSIAAVMLLLFCGASIVAGTVLMTKD